MKNQIVYPLIYILMAFILTVIGFLEEKPIYLIISLIVYFISFSWLNRILKNKILN